LDLIRAKEYIKAPGLIGRWRFVGGGGKDAVSLMYSSCIYALYRAPVDAMMGYGEPFCSS